MADDQYKLLYCKVHPHAVGAKGGNQDMNRTKGAYETFSVK